MSDRQTSSTSLPVMVLTVLGALIAVLGLFAAGEILVVAVGLGAVAVAAIIGAIERGLDRRDP
jgi:hypothetical protein